MEDKTVFADEEMARIGDQIALFFGLEKDVRGYYQTAWGQKTSIGVYKSVRSFMDLGPF